MSAFLLKSKSALFAVVALCLCRFFEYFSLAPMMATAQTPLEGLQAINNIAFASFVAVPLFGIVVSRSATVLFNTGVVVLHGTRSALSLRFLSGACVEALAYSIIFGATALPLQFFSFGIGFDSLPLLLASLVLQTVFFLVCALLFSLIFMTTRLTALSYCAVILYGLWDFMALNVVGGGVPFIGWAHTLVQIPFEPADAVSKAAFLLAVASVLFLAIAVIVRQVDFLAKRGA